MSIDVVGLGFWSEGVDSWIRYHTSILSHRRTNRHRESVAGTSCVMSEACTHACQLSFLCGSYRPTVNLFRVSLVTGADWATDVAYRWRHRHFPHSDSIDDTINEQVRRRNTNTEVLILAIEIGYVSSNPNWFSISVCVSYHCRGEILNCHRFQHK